MWRRLGRRRAGAVALAAHVTKVRGPAYVEVGDGLVDRPLEAQWRVERDRAAQVTAEDFEWSDFAGGTRPATKEGREGRD